MSELKNQELPPLELTQEERTKAEGMAKAILESGAPLDCIESYVLHVYARERQLSAALNELKAKDTELAAKDARIAELTAYIAERDKRMHGKFVASPDGSNKCACAYCVGDTEALADHCADMECQLFLTGGFKDRAEAAEKSLGAVSEVLKETTLPCEHQSIRDFHKPIHYYGRDEIDPLFAKLRSIVEGK